MIPFPPPEAALAVASSVVAPTALAAAASPSRLAASMSLTSAPPPMSEARSQAVPADGAAIAGAGADASSPDSSSSSESATSPSPSTFARGGLGLGFRVLSCAGPPREPSTLPGLDPSRLDVPLSTSTTLDASLGGARRALWGRGGGRRELGGGDRSRVVDAPDWSLSGSDRSTGSVREELVFGASSSSESLCGGGGGANASGDGDLARGGDGSRRGGEGSRSRWGGSRREGGAAPAVLSLSPANVSPARVLRTASGASPADAARASCWRNAFVCSGSSPATIFSGLARTCSPSASPTHAMILVSHATLLSLSLTFPESLSTASKRPRANPVFRVTSDTTSWRNLNGGFFRRFSVSCGGRGDRVWVGVSGRGGQRRIFEKATRDGSRSAVGRGRALAFGLRTIGSEPCRSSCVTVQYSAMVPTPSPRTRPGAFELCAPPSETAKFFRCRTRGKKLQPNAGEIYCDKSSYEKHGSVS